jgi:anthranilate phosphoribosyltransferase
MQDDSWALRYDRRSPCQKMLSMTVQNTSPTFHAAPLIKEIGRGVKGARALSRNDAEQLFEAMLQGLVSDVELGAVLMAYRIKGETPDELAGMLDAAHRHCGVVTPLTGKRVVVIPSYNGARKQPNLVPLLALLLQQAGIPVLVHGASNFGGRVTSLELFEGLGILSSPSVEAASAQLQNTGLSVLSIEALSPALSTLLDMRTVVGLRNSAHTIVKMLQPVGDHGSSCALQLVSYTHPEYRETLRSFFTARDANVLLTRGTEGEAVADARRGGRIDHLRSGVLSELVSGEEGSIGTVVLPNGTDKDATVAFIRGVLDGTQPVPAPIARQIAVIQNAMQ